MRRWISILLTSVIISLSPGLGSYQALALSREASIAGGQAPARFGEIGAAAPLGTGPVLPTTSIKDTASVPAGLSPAAQEPSALAAAAVSPEVQPAGDAEEQVFDAVIIGSGYGGSPAALRLAQADLKVAVLEQGLRHKMGEFPRGEDAYWNPTSKLFGTHWIRSIGRRIKAWGGSGVGGGSLVNASVMIRKEDFSGFPGGITRQALDPYYERVEDMLDAKPYPFLTPGSPYADTPKSHFMAKAAKLMGSEVVVPKLAVTFQEPGEVEGTVKENKFGAEGQGCRRCGECSLPGCNYGAKNTLDRTYLFHAEHAFGAKVLERHEAGKIEQLPDKTYRVRFRDPVTGREGSYRTRILISSAGLGSPRILLRNKQLYKTLPDLSDRLGENYTTNGNFIGFAVNARKDVHPARGPEITAGIEFKGEDGKGQGFYVFDGSYRQPWLLIGRLLGLPLFITRIIDRVLKKLQAWGWIKTENTLPLLVLGRDRSVGKLVLDEKGELDAKINTRLNKPYYRRVESALHRITRSMGTSFLPFVMWHFRRKIDVPHSLGGVPMGENPEEGVVDDAGRVFGYDNMLVLDGSIMPASLGVNPALTIAAISERAMDIVIEQFKREGVIRAAPKPRD